MGHIDRKVMQFVVQGFIHASAGRGLFVQVLNMLGQHIDLIVRIFAVFTCKSCDTAAAFGFCRNRDTVRHTICK